MNVRNIHQREFPIPPAQVGALIDSLASREDRLWPWRSWPRMKLDRPLGVGAHGGHGPVRYFVEAFEPGRSVRFRFTGPKGFDGYHALEVVDSGEGRCALRHTLEMTARGAAAFTWPLFFRPLHDALIEDAFTVAETSLGLPPQVKRWSPWVRVLRRVAGGGRAGAQVPPGPSPR